MLRDCTHACRILTMISLSCPTFSIYDLSAKLWEEGKLDLDAPIQKYVTSFPEKSFRGSPVTLTTRHLLSHLGGIRHYQKPTTSSKENKTEKEKKGRWVGCQSACTMIFSVVKLWCLISKECSKF